MDILGKLMGGDGRVRMLRLFILNPETVFKLKEIEEKSKLSTKIVKREIKLLNEVDFIRPKHFNIALRKKVKGKPTYKQVEAWHINQSFPLLKPIKSLLFNAEIFEEKEIIEKFKNTGRIRLIVTAGVFTNDESSRADLLVVGDNINRRSFDNAIKSIESEIGRELNYGVFDTEDFKYRLTVFDKFVRDILDYPHKKILDKLGS